MKNDFHIFKLEIARLIRADGHRYKAKNSITNEENATISVYTYYRSFRLSQFHPYGRSKAWPYAVPVASTAFINPFI